MKSQKRSAHKAWVSRHRADGLSRTTHIEVAFECSGGSPRFPSYLLSLDTARKFYAELGAQLERVTEERADGLADYLVERHGL